jgi:predicted lipoprotein
MANQQATNGRVRKVAKILIVLAFAVFVLYHSVYFEKLSERHQKASHDSFDPQTYVENFWTELQKITENAVKATTLLQLFESDMSQAVARYGKTLGVSSNHSYLLKGEGRVIEIQEETILVRLSSDTMPVTMAVQTDFIFGNDIRDASGLVRVSDFPSTMEFNAISSHINGIVKASVLPPILKKVETGDQLRFVAAATVNEESPDLDPLNVVPIKLEIAE